MACYQTFGQDRTVEHVLTSWACLQQLNMFWADGHVLWACFELLGISLVSRVSNESQHLVCHVTHFVHSCYNFSCSTSWLGSPLSTFCALLGQQINNKVFLFLSIKNYCWCCVLNVGEGGGYCDYNIGTALQYDAMQSIVT